MRREVAVGAAAFVAMEPVTYAAHRWVMHGIGWALHRSHHSAVAGRFEANDAFPVMFAAATMAAMVAGTRARALPPAQRAARALPPAQRAARALRLALPGGAGVTAYGAAYAFVHDVYTHGRLGRLPAWAPLERLKQAHAVHHLFGGEPYGMLCPWVPKELSERAAARKYQLASRRWAPATTSALRERSEVTLAR